MVVIQILWKTWNSIWFWPDLCFLVCSVWISNHQTLQFSPLCLVLSRFSSSRVSLESKLCVCFQSFVFFSPSASLFFLAGCVLESQCVPVCVFANERVQALFFFWTSLWCCCLFIYFSACEGPFSAVRATADWACDALSAIHQRGASLTDEPVTSAPYSTSAWSWSYAWGFLFSRRRSVTRRAFASSPTCLAEYQYASHVKQLFHLWPADIALRWFSSDDGALVVVAVLFMSDLIPVCSSMVMLCLRPFQSTFIIINRHTQSRTDHAASS